MYATKAEVDRIALPRSLVGRRRRTYRVNSPYRFQIGDRVMFHDSEAIILSRSRSMMGRELFYIQLISGEIAGRPFRTVYGFGLIPSGNPNEDRRQAHTDT
ncbi:hypothetical protein QA644_08225 [Rhizobium sp. CC1099]|uniref:hypothetical protein n=1 Tax=Rhizobium sp. CC1099 TaxID=3039160 RepID=UPI0024B11EE5|nr:hypothetical protein [Rhizobium sp. CC1099]WFU89015.1 hypothetical protein QA644_08225 [Rhizobium sp. CC1099]